MKNDITVELFDNKEEFVQKLTDFPVGFVVLAFSESEGYYVATTADMKKSELWKPAIELTQMLTRKAENEG